MATEERVTVTVNNNPMPCAAGEMAVKDIKESAITAGIAIELTHQVSVQTPDGDYKVLVDDETVEIVEDTVFVATPCYDNS